MKKRKSKFWKLSGIFFSIALGILSGPGVLLFAKYLRHISYVSLSNKLCSGFFGDPRLSIINPSKSCHMYCLTLQVHLRVCSGW